VGALGRDANPGKRDETMTKEIGPDLQRALDGLDAAIDRLAKSDGALDRIAIGRLQVAQWAVKETLDLFELSADDAD
jgi:hypothetical protein